MTTLTLDQLKLILCEQNDVNLAAQLMRDMGFDVTECTVGFPTYHFDFKPYTVIFRDDKREGGFSFTILERFDLKERKAFLESQQQPTDTVPAVSTVAEARPDLPVLQEPCECSKCKSAHGILNVYAHGLVTVGCPDCWHSDQSLISVMAETFFTQCLSGSNNQ